MRYSRFFLEGSCFVLLFDVVRDPTRHGCEKNFDLVAEGLKCFAKLPMDEILHISTNGVIRILEASKKSVSRTMGNDDDTVMNSQEVLLPQTNTGTLIHLESATRPALNHSDASSYSAPLTEDPFASAAYEFPVPQLDTIYENPLGGFDSEFGMDNLGDAFNTEFFDMGYYLWMDDIISSDIDRTSIPY